MTANTLFSEEVVMTRRQQYAAMALQGILSNGSMNALSADTSAKMAFVYADAMLMAERPENFSEQRGEE